MGMLDAFNQLNEVRSFEQVNEEYHQQPVSEWDKNLGDPNAWLDRYTRFVERPRFNPNMDGYISAYSSGHWGGTTDLMNAFQLSADLGPLQEKVEPNKIFTSDIAALKTMAADQAKIIKVFERKAMESLNDKGKFGLNEDDIEAMQALTSARSTLMSIQEKQINVKKAIAELKIKQQQATGAVGPQQGSTGGKTNVYDIGRSIMDNMFDINIGPQQTETTINANYPTIDVDQASDVLNSIVDAGNVAATTVFEADKPTTYVVVGDTDSDTEYVTKSKSGEIIEEYPNPDARITKVNHDTNTAIDELMNEYPVIRRDELNL